MNTERTPDQIAAELYPITAYKNMWEEAVIKRERAAWLSRQSEVDELKRQVEELMAFNETCLQNNKSLTAAKEKEMEDWKTIANVYKQRNNELTDPPQMAMGDVNHLEATHDAEMCAFAEWIGVRGWEYSSTNWCFWDINHELISVKTTTELLTKFRER